MELNTVYNELMKDYDGKLDHSGVNGKRLAERLAALSEIGKTTDGGVTRPGFSAEEKQAKELVIDWMKEAGLEVTTDGAGNVFGRLEGRDDGPTILSGSHVDSVPNGGNFDGPLGVLSALEVAQSWKETGYIPPLPYETVIFSDEEGSRFKAGFTGSKAFMGKMTNETLDPLQDETGASFNEVIEKYGSSREEYLKPASEGKDIGMFVEVHIEQGSILEEKEQPVGIVTGIAGPAWVEVVFTGKAGHAGNTPMEKRKDPVVAAGMFIQEVETLPRKVSNSAVATVGKMDVHPNGINVIAQDVKLMVDLRDIRLEWRDQLLNLVTDAAEKIAEERGIQVSWNIESKTPPLEIKKEWQEKLARVITEMGGKPVFIPSGAGHDAMILGEQYPTAMIFAQSKDGISHNPEEWTSLHDAVSTVHVLKVFIEEVMEKNE